MLSFGQTHKVVAVVGHRRKYHAGGETASAYGDTRGSPTEGVERVSTSEDRLAAETHWFERTVDHHPYRCADRAHYLEVLLIYRRGKIPAFCPTGALSLFQAGVQDGEANRPKGAPRRAVPGRSGLPISRVLRPTNPESEPPWIRFVKRKAIGGATWPRNGRKRETEGRHQPTTGVTATVWATPVLFRIPTRRDSLCVFH